MRWLMSIVTAIMLSNAVWSADVGVDMKSIHIDLHNKASLQRGARYFMNYCSGCHSLRYLRYNRMAKDIGLTTFDGSVDKALLKNNLIFTSATPQDPIEIAMPAEDARQWFGRLPPDLSLSARERGAAWIYTYLASFYKDASRPYGANNLLVPDVSMPNVLAPLQGNVLALKGDNTADKMPHLKLVLVDRGSMSQQQFDSTLKDLVTFLVYAAEPHKLDRYVLGWGVIIFLLIMAVLMYLLKTIYWRNIH